MKALENGPFGRCVYHCDNDVVDTQVINMKYENGVTVAFSMTAYSEENVTGQSALRAPEAKLKEFGKSEFVVKDFATGRRMIPYGFLRY